MEPTSDDHPTPWDNLKVLPRRNWLSMSTVLAVQALNAFNDNFVKILLIALAPVVAAGTQIGDNMELMLGAIFALPYILFAPVAGFLSDRFPKKKVIVWMQAVQLVCFAWLIGALMLRKPEASLWLSLAGFLLLATQAAFISPAKMGVGKELVGSRRLGMVSGWLQMTMMAGVLGGMWAGGTWFGVHYEQSHDAWDAALWPMIIVGGVAVLQFFISFAIQPTPAHAEVPFRRAMLWEHFANLKSLFAMRHIRLAALGITYFWFLSNAISLIIVTLMKETYASDSAGGNAKALASAAAVLGVGVILGSVTASVVCKRRIELGLVPLGGLGFVIGLLWAGFAPLGSNMVYAGLIFTGFSGGCFMAPLYAFVQDRAHPAERARVIAAINLLDSVAAILAVLIVSAMKLADLSAGTQFICLAVPSAVAAIFMLKLLPSDFVRMICMSFVRTTYKVRAVHSERVPRTGALMMLPNHVSYVDALIIGTASPRLLRFVIWDVLYKVRYLNGFLRLFGTVPISPTRAKDAVRTVATALKEQGAVCIFPEGQITRTGMINGLQRGFELMARQGDAPVLPVFMDQLYGSIFSFKGGRFFKKWPKRVRYPLTVYFGEPIPPREATTDRVRAAMLQLGSEAFLHRKQFDDIAPDSQQALANAMRLDEIELLRADDTLIIMPGASDIIRRTCLAMPRTPCLDLNDIGLAAPHSVHAIATSDADIEALVSSPDWPRVRCAVLWWGAQLTSDLQESLEQKLGCPALLGFLDLDTGALIAQNIPDPEMAPGDEGLQLGVRAGTLGRLLPGLAVAQNNGTLEISGLAPENPAVIRLPGHSLDESGFIVL